MSRPTKKRTRGSAEQQQDLPLTRDEAERILRAPASARFPLPADWDKRVAYLALALNKLTARIAELSTPAHIGISPEHLRKLRKAKKALADLGDLIAELGLEPYPERWAGRVRTEIDGRMAFAELDKRNQARPAMEHHGVMYPRLLTFFTRTYGCPPGQSPGPAHRFLRKWLEVAGAYLKHATAPKQRGLSKPNWRQPSDGYLVKLIVRYRQVPKDVQEEVDRLIGDSKREQGASGKKARAG